MAVNLPTSTDVQKAREQAAEQATVVRTPLLAVLGVGDYAYTTVNKAVTDARTRAEKRAEEVQTRVSELPNEISELRTRLSSDHLRKQVDEIRDQAETVYSGFAKRGEKAWGRIRKQPQVKQAISTVEDYTEKFDARVDEFVDTTHDAAEKALGTVTRETRSLGERTARTAQQVAGQAAEAVTEASKDASKSVAEAGTDAASAIDEAGDEVASTTRSTTRKAANKTAPKTTARKPAARRSTNGGSTASK
jgi:heparin binding hemagglutinin HbhA